LSPPPPPSSPVTALSPRNAVARALTQVTLGYVAAGETHRFEHAVAPGYVAWVAGAHDVPGALLGAAAVTLPALRAAHVAVLPRRLVQALDLSATLPAAVWAALEARVVEGALGLCQVTGLETVRLQPELVCAL
jgi:hypothetical protein